MGRLVVRAVYRQERERIEPATRYWTLALAVWLLSASTLVSARPQSDPAVAAAIITEFMAANDSTLADEDGDYPDWIEIYNGGATDVDLDGWYLTDDDGDLTQWQFPPVALSAGEYLIVFASDKDRAAAGSELHANFKLKSSGEYLALVRPDGATVAWEYAPQYPPQFEDVSYGLDEALHERYFTAPTPGAANGTGPGDSGPIISGVAHSPSWPTPDDAITVTVTIEESLAPVAAATMHYRVMYGITTTVPLFDDGAHGDDAAGDAIYGATIPGDAHQAGEMVRYAITAADTEGRVSRWPLFSDPADSPAYLGTMIADPGVTSALPILYWFVQDAAAARTSEGTRAALFYDGRFYDNVYVRIRGGTSVYYPKKSFKFDFNTGYYFHLAPDIAPMEEINLNTTYSDKAYIRQILAFETYRDAGAPASLSFPMRVQQNGSFYGVHIFVEQPDERYLERQGLDPVGALYKMYNPLDSATHVGKRTRLDEDNGDLQALIDGVNLPKAIRMNYLLDHVDIPTVINYLAATALIHDAEGGHKNYYLYRDTEGTGEWMFLPWDKDLSFGRHYGPGVLNDDMRADDHPFMLRTNALANALYAPPVQEMYVRRLRTLMDALLQPPGAPAAQLRYEQRIDELIAQMEADLVLDAARWPVEWGEPQTLAEAIHILKTDYLAARRACLYDHYGPGEVGLLPDAQPITATVGFGVVEFDPASGDQDQEYFTLVNPNSYAVDISGWMIANDVEYTFRPGVVIPADNKLYVSPDVVAFRNRAVSPKGGQGRFVQGGYDGHLSNARGVLELYNVNGTLVASATFGLPLSPFAGQLIVTELNYHPPDGDEEFIELKNTASITLHLGGFRFTDGIDYTFPAATDLGPGDMLVLVSDEAAFADRYSGVAYAGVYGGRLSNGGEAVTLVDGAGLLVTAVEYDDEFPWPETADGGGDTLARRDPASSGGGNPEMVRDPCRWRSSAHAGGSPGVDDPPGGAAVCDAMVEVRPRLASALQVTDGRGRPLTLHVPAGAVTQTTMLLYSGQNSVSSTPTGYLWSGWAFSLGAYRDGALLSDWAFQLPVTLTVGYTDADVVSVQEATLAWFAWDGAAWQAAASTCALPHTSVHTATNRVEFVMRGWAGASYPLELGLFARSALFLSKRVAPLTGDLGNLGDDDGGLTLTYTLTLCGPDLEVRLWDPLPAGVRYVDGSVTPPAVYSAALGAILWQGTLPTGTAHIVRFQVTPRISGTAQMATPIVNTAWLTDTGSGQSVRAIAIFNARRVYLPLVARNQ